MTPDIKNVKIDRFKINSFTHDTENYLKHAMNEVVCITASKHWERPSWVSLQNSYFEKF